MRPWALKPGAKGAAPGLLQHSAWRLPFMVSVVAAIASFAGLIVVSSDVLGREYQPVGAASTRAELQPLRDAAAATPIERTAAPAARGGPAAPIRPLNTKQQTELISALADVPNGTSIVVTRMNDGLHAEIRGGQVQYAASLFKLAVLYEAERQRSTGVLDFATSVYPDFSEDLGTSGRLPLSEDGSLSIGEALFYMITVSDNASAVGLMRFLGSGRIDETLRGLGIVDTSVTTEELPTTAKDMARLMQAIVTGEGVDLDAKAHMRDLLLAQTHRFGLPASAKGDVRVGNKTGTWAGALHDVAFVEARSGTYVIAILTDGSMGWEGIAEWGRRVFAVLGRD